MTELTTVYYMNPFYLDNKQVLNFTFFRDGKELYTSQRGWFGSHQKEFSLYIGEDIKKKIKLDLSVKKSFYMTASSSYTSSKKDAVKIFLYADGKDIDVTFGETYEETTDKTIYVWQPVTIKIFDKVYEEKFIVETRITDFGKECEKMSNKLKEEGINIDSWSLQRLLKLYDLVEK